MSSASEEQSPSDPLTSIYAGADMVNIGHTLNM